MLLALIGLSIAFSILCIYLLYYKYQIKDMSNQLSFIIQNDSFKFINLQMRPKEVYQLVEQCNHLLSKQREVNKQFLLRNEEINQTIVSLSHDIRTPLTSLGGYLQLAQSTEHPQEQQRYMTLAQSRMDQIVTLVDQLFFYTKLQNPEYIIPLDSIDIVDILHQRLLYFLDEFSHKQYEPSIQLPEDSIYIIGNTSAAERVFENIISNYLTHGTGPLTIHYEEKDGQVTIYFTNQLKQNHTIQTEQLFTRFYKHDLPRTTHSSGLGLSIVQSLMEKLNGQAEVNLEEGQFCISVTFVQVGKGKVLL